MYIIGNSYIARVLFRDYHFWVGGGGGEWSRKMPQTFMDMTNIISTLIKAYSMYTDPNDYSDKFICIL